MFVSYEVGISCPSLTAIKRYDLDKSADVLLMDHFEVEFAQAQLQESQRYSTHNMPLIISDCLCWRLLLCGCCAVAMRLLCCCYAVALRLLCGCYAKPSKTSHLTIFNEFVKVVTCISRLLPNKNNLKFVPDSLISIHSIGRHYQIQLISFLSSINYFLSSFFIQVIMIWPQNWDQ